MSFNRSVYDQSSYKNELQRNVGILGHVMNVDKYEHTKQFRHNFGFVAGNNISHIQGNMVDLSSELSGITRYISKCNDNIYIPSKDGIIRNDKTPNIDTNPKHLRTVQSIAYQSIPLPYTTKEGNSTRCFI
jgi:hypothetical protein